MPPTFVGFRLRLRLRRDRLNQARQSLAEVYISTKKALASVSEPSLKPTQWAIAHSPQCRRVSAETGGEIRKIIQALRRSRGPTESLVAFHASQLTCQKRRTPCGRGEELTLLVAKNAPRRKTKNSRCSLRSLTGSAEPIFCMRAYASLNLSPRQWAAYLSPGVEAR